MKPASRAPAYLSAAVRGRNDWWRYGLGVLTVLTVGMILSILLWFSLLRANLTIQQEDQIRIVDPLLSYVVANLHFCFWLLGLWATMSILHRRSLLTLISSEGSIHLRRIFEGFGIWFLFIGSPLALSLILDPASLVIRIHWSEWFKFLMLALILTPIQTTTEELFFRGYVLQGMGLITRRPGLLCLISGVLFLLPHLGNPELAHGWWPLVTYYLIFGMFQAWITLKDNRLELAIGLHAANNLFSALFVTYENAVLETPALFKADEVDGVAVVLRFLICAGGFSYLCFGIRNGIKESDL